MNVLKEADGEMVMKMLRRVSMEIDVKRINMEGMTALHQLSLVSGHTTDANRSPGLLFL